MLEARRRGRGRAQLGVFGEPQASGLATRSAAPPRQVGDQREDLGPARGELGEQSRRRAEPRQDEPLAAGSTGGAGPELDGGSGRRA